ncbi:MAG: hypothetical protein JWQ19_1328 [Subtercola sp.]|nr:hypothetical protein [Subtercola sp.]
MKTTARRNISALAFVAAATLVMSGCAASSTSADSTSSTAASGGEALLIPQQTGAAPGSYIDDSNNLVGFMPDLSTAAGGQMGATVTNEATTFENALLGLSSGKYATVPGADVTPERLLKFDFATMWDDSYTFAVPASSTLTIDNSMDALCGLSVAAVASSSPIVPLDAQSTTCTSAGKQPINVMTFPDFASAELAATSGQANTWTNTVGSLQYEDSTTPGKLKITGPQYQKVQIGFAVPKGSDLGPKLVTAMNALIANGTYASIFAKYDVPGLSSMATSELVTK